MERVYKVSEVARMLNVSAVAVRKWIRGKGIFQILYSAFLTISSTFT
jgi:predicted transcriptional regulator